MFARQRASLVVFSIGLGFALSAIAVGQELRFTIPLQLDKGGQPFDGAAHRYRLKFTPTSLPPAKEWSLALYQLPDQNRVRNSIDRYAITSQMLPSLHRNPDGSLTIYIQHDPPSDRRKANWLPAPQASFLLQLQLDKPAQPVLTGAWEPPSVERVE